MTKPLEYPRKEATPLALKVLQNELNRWRAKQIAGRARKFTDVELVDIRSRRETAKRCSERYSISESWVNVLRRRP